MSSSKDKGIDATNQEFKRYEQVRKDQDYHLAEKEAEDQFDGDYVIQTCDMSQFFDGGEAGKEKFAQQLGAAFGPVGARSREDQDSRYPLVDTAGGLASARFGL